MTASAPDYTVEPIAEGAIFTIERPAKLNALTKPVLLGLAATLDARRVEAAFSAVRTSRREQRGGAPPPRQRARPQRDPADGDSLWPHDSTWLLTTSAVSRLLAG